MKKILTASLILAAVAVAFTSCDDKAKLASEITGAWTGAPERIATDDNTTTSVTRVITFLTDEESSTGGTLEASALFDIESGTKLQATDIQPISVTANGTATISGRWEATDEDEIIVTFDYSTMKIDVDPEGVELQYDLLTQESTPVTDSISASMAASIRATMERAMPHEVFNYSKIDDIKIKNGLMSCEIDKKDYSFHKDM